MTLFIYYCKTLWMEKWKAWKVYKMMRDYPRTVYSFLMDKNFIVIHLGIPFVEMKDKNIISPSSSMNWPRSFPDWEVGNISLGEWFSTSVTLRHINFISQNSPTNMPHNLKLLSLRNTSLEEAKYCLCVYSTQGSYCPRNYQSQPIYCVQLK